MDGWMIGLVLILYDALSALFVYILANKPHKELVQDHLGVFFIERLLTAHQPTL